jgi:hypothetical protein
MGDKMKNRSYILLSSLLGLFLLLTSLPGLAQREQFQAQAFGEGTQAGHTFGVTVIINEYSTTDDQKALIEAFSARGSQGLYNALHKMPSKGRIRITGTLGYEINYAKAFQTPTGRKIRIVTDRPITFGEAWSDSRSEDYNLSALELDVNSEGKGTGILLPACQFQINKEHELAIEAYRNPWRMADVFRW